jgi:raffinose/stachyose/melibiose transport system permease protein
LTQRIERAGSMPARSRWSGLASVGLFLLPALVLYAVFVLIPIVQAAHYSLYKWNGLTPLTDFIGIANYQRALADPIFIKAVTHNAIIIVLS